MKLSCDRPTVSMLIIRSAPTDLRHKHVPGHSALVCVHTPVFYGFNLCYFSHSFRGRRAIFNPVNLSRRNRMRNFGGGDCQNKSIKSNPIKAHKQENGASYTHTHTHTHTNTHIHHQRKRNAPLSQAQLSVNHSCVSLSCCHGCFSHVGLCLMVHMSKRWMVFLSVRVHAGSEWAVWCFSMVLH